MDILESTSHGRRHTSGGLSSCHIFDFKAGGECGCILARMANGRRQTNADLSSCLVCASSNLVSGKLHISIAGDLGPSCGAKSCSCGRAASGRRRLINALCLQVCHLTCTGTVIVQHALRAVGA